MAKEKISPWRRLRRRYDHAVLRYVRGELSGRRLVLYGCREILTYGRECIVLSVEDAEVCAVCVVGRRLLCLSYHSDAVVIEGEICDVRLCRDGESGAWEAEGGTE